MAPIDSLRGKLLVAAPQLEDYFHRTVVLVLEHTDEGAMGLVLNRPTESEVIEAVPSLSDLVDSSDLVHAGGPVQPDSVLVLGDFEEPEDAGTQVVGTLGLLDPERPEAELNRVRVFAGYAGWAPGQLDLELEQEAWIVVPADPDDAFSEEDLWGDALRRKGGEYALLATMPADPSLN
ncbi:MAG TPA: YqgE/AlgH family protein [Thermoleophilaceae bacterium]|nr:YqgE/AlgH family protein [Thermoleophilaceae bacterium]